MWGSPEAFVTSKPLRVGVMNTNLQAASDGQRKEDDDDGFESVCVKAEPKPQSDPLIKILCILRCHDVMTLPPSLPPNQQPAH